MAGDLSQLTIPTQRLVRACSDAALRDLLDVDSPGVALAPFETVCGVCHLAHNAQLACTNCSGRG